MNTPKWTDADFALMSGPELDHAHKALADAWCQHTSSAGGAIGDVTVNALQAQMRRIGYLMNPATEASLRRGREPGQKPQGIAIAPADEYLPELGGQKKRKGISTAAPIDAADRSVKAAKRGGQRLSELSLSIIRMHKEGMTNADIRKAARCHHSRVWQVIERYQEVEGAQV